MVERNIIMGKAGGTAGKNSVNYKISLPAEMVKELKITPRDKSVFLDSFFDAILIWKKTENHDDTIMSAYGYLSFLQDKLEAKKPKINLGFYACPVCGSVRSIKQKHDYCHDCGQKLDWSVE